MRIDVHTHLWPVEKTPDYLLSYFNQQTNTESITRLSADGLMQSMDESGIQKSIVSALCFSPAYSNDDLDCFNQYVKQQVGLYPNRLSGFCTINPMEKDAIKYLCKLIEVDGFKGLKLHCNMQQFYPDDSRLYPIYQKMQDYHLPILFHSGGIGLPPIRDHYGQPSRFDSVACDFPHLTIILGHAGRIWYDETAMMLRKHKHVLADISTNIGREKISASAPMALLLDKIKTWAGSTNALLFGSDYPFYSQKATVNILESIPAENKTVYTTAKDIEFILAVNAQRFCDEFKIFNC